jgi:hypothetical protein
MKVQHSCDDNDCGVCKIYEDVANGQLTQSEAIKKIQQLLPPSDLMELFAELAKALK